MKAHLIIWFALAVRVFAHDPGLSTLNVRLHSDRLDVVLVLSMKDAAGLTGMPGDSDGRTASSERAVGGSELAPACLATTMGFNPAIA